MTRSSWTLDLWHATDLARLTFARATFGAIHGLALSERSWDGIFGADDSGESIPECLDHCEVWSRDGEVVALTAHVYPHALDAGARAVFAEMERGGGVVVRVGTVAESWHAPGQTVLVEVWRRSAAPREPVKLPAWPRPLRAPREARPRGRAARLPGAFRAGFARRPARGAPRDPRPAPQGC